MKPVVWGTAGGLLVAAVLIGIPTLITRDTYEIGDSVLFLGVPCVLFGFLVGLAISWGRRARGR